MYCMMLHIQYITYCIMLHVLYYTYRIMLHILYSMFMNQILLYSTVNMYFVLQCVAALQSAVKYSMYWMLLDCYGATVSTKQAVQTVTLGYTATLPCFTLLDFKCDSCEHKVDRFTCLFNTWRWSRCTQQKWKAKFAQNTFSIIIIMVPNTM